ncbi:MAG TPA: hypothetical protein VKY24_08790 [Reyranella sp.]|nr:hypothetical protein [Reyranella sp.]
MDTLPKAPSQLNALYYPFSRAIDVQSLKQQLLLFDTISFLDPVDSEQWRAKLFRNLEEEQSKAFRAYRDFYRELPGLIRAGVIKIHDPAQISSINEPEVTASIVSDLHDANWTKAASRPQAFGLPFLPDRQSGQPTWQIFYPKMPSKFVELLTQERKLQRHLIYEGDESVSWSLTYAAGSAVAINTHLAVADQLNCVPLTDSEMHHRLLLRKVARSTERRADVDDPIKKTGTRSLAARLNTTLIQSIMSPEALSRLSVDDIMRFREDTQKARAEFVVYVENKIRTRLDGISDAGKAEIVTKEISEEIRKELHEYRGELERVRDTLWPRLLSNKNIASAVPALVAAIFLGANFTIAASILPALAIAATLLEGRKDRRIAERRASPALTYLTKVHAIS